LPIYLVAAPGLTPWAQSAMKGPADLAAKISPEGSAPGLRASSKRPRDDVPRGPLDDGNLMPVSGAAGVDAAMFEPNSEPDVTCPADAIKRPAIGSPNNDQLHPGLGRNLPVVPRPGAPVGAPCAVVAKLYDAQRSIRLHTLVEVVGVLHPGPPGRVHPDISDEGKDDWLAGEDRNPAGIPRIHVVSMRVLDDDSPDPLCPLIGALAQSQSVPREDALRELKETAMPTMREIILKYLASAIGGDLVAAEYLLYTLVGRPVIRPPAGGVLGKLTLNLVLPDGAQAHNADDIVAALEALVPALVRLRVTVPNLNLTELYPKKDYTANRLQAAPLQLPSGCLLVADETALDNGKLLERGVKNVRAVAMAAQKAVVPVDFQYYESELHFNGNALLLSKACKAVVPGDAVVRVMAAADDMGLQSWRTYDSAIMHKMRLTLSLLAEDGKFTIPQETTRAIEDTFVEARKCGAIGADPEQVLSRWLAVARTAARSFGEDSLSIDRWNYVINLERQVDSRHAATISKN
jgi:hypothetical protein